MEYCADGWIIIDFVLYCKYFKTHELEKLIYNKNGSKTGTNPIRVARGE